MSPLNFHEYSTRLTVERLRRSRTEPRGRSCFDSPSRKPRKISIIISILRYSHDARHVADNTGYRARLTAAVCRIRTPCNRNYAARFLPAARQSQNASTHMHADCGWSIAVHIYTLSRSTDPPRRRPIYRARV